MSLLNVRPGVLPALFLLAVSGCASGTGDLRLVSFVDPYFPDAYSQHLTDCTYRVDGGGDLHVAAVAQGPAATPAREIEQALHLHVFWKPRPGTTVDHPTALNADIRYAIHSAGGSAYYAGAGYAFLKRSRLGDGMEIEIEDSELALVGRLGELPEVLGRLRMTGALSAKPGSNHTVEVCRRIDALAERCRGGGAAHLASQE